MVTNREQIQQDIVKSIIKTTDVNGRVRCTVEAITGIGKTFISFFAIKELKPKTVLFLAETTIREQGIHDDIIKFKEIYGYDILKHHTVSFACYQSVYKWVGKYHDMVVADEIHDSLTPEYFKYYKNNRYTHLLGLSATIDKNTVFKYADGSEYTKIELLNEIAPICFTYNIKDGQEHGTSRKLIISVIEQELDDRVKCIPVKYKSKLGKQEEFYQTEKKAYDYCHQRYVQSMYSDSDFLKRYWMNKRNTLIYNLPSKVQTIISLLQVCDFEKTIVFGNSLEQLNKICPTVSSKHKADVNKQLIDDFNNGKLNTIGSFKMLKQGVNLKDLNNVILHSYYSVEKDFIQRVGRMRNKDTPGNVIVLVTKSTQEWSWLNKLLETIKVEYTVYTSIKDYIKCTQN